MKRLKASRVFNERTPGQKLSLIYLDDMGREKYQRFQIAYNFMQQIIAGYGSGVVYKVKVRSIKPVNSIKIPDIHPSIKATIVTVVQNIFSAYILLLSSSYWLC